MPTTTERHAPVTVLLVENDVGRSDRLRSLFEESSSNLTVIVAATLKDALAHERSQVHAVVCDLGLPDSSGRETLDALFGHFAPAPVIVLDAAAGNHIADEAHAIRNGIRRAADRMAAVLRDEQNRAVAQLGQLALTNVSTTTLLSTICELI